MVAVVTSAALRARLSGAPQLVSGARSSSSRGYVSAASARPRPSGLSTTLAYDRATFARCKCAFPAQSTLLAGKPFLVDDRASKNLSFWGSSKQPAHRLMRHHRFLPSSRDDEDEAANAAHELKQSARSFLQNAGSSVLTACSRHNMQLPMPSPPCNQSLRSHQHSD